MDTDLLGAQIPTSAVFFLLGQGLLLVAFIAAFFLARTHKGREHYYLMTTAFLIDQLLFKPLMISRALSIWGPFPWPGTGIVYHVLLDLAVVILGVVTVYLGFKYRLKKNRRIYLPAKGKVHRQIGMVFILAWAATYAAGVLAMYHLYHV